VSFALINTLRKIASGRCAKRIILQKQGRNR
jgi:hypothetical protein